MRPRRVQPTPVYRFYRGGALLGRFRGIEQPDDYFPEDWVASTTPAHNPGRDEPEAGLSRLADGPLLRNAVAADPAAWLGRPHLDCYGLSTGLLVKLLDTAERLPVHAHPDRGFARTHFGSAFGKTEAWVVLATREATAEVRVGLREPVDPSTYLRWIREQDTDALLGSLNPVTVTAGDLVYVPAGVPHAIGAGVLIAELQEPTDFSILCEWNGFPIAADNAHLGLGFEIALGALDLEPHEPVRTLPPQAAPFFCVDEVAEPAGRFAVWLVLDGEGTIDGVRAGPGDGFAVPATATEIDVAGEVRVLRCLAPEPAQ